MNGVSMCFGTQRLSKSCLVSGAHFQWKTTSCFKNCMLIAFWEILIPSYKHCLLETIADVNKLLSVVDCNIVDAISTVGLTKFCDGMTVGMKDNVSVLEFCTIIYWIYVSSISLSSVSMDQKGVVSIYIYTCLLLWSPSITDDDDFLFNVEDTTWRGRIHVLTKLKVRRGCTVPSQLTWPSTKKSDGTKEFATTDSMDGCKVLPETQSFRTRLRVDTTRVLYVGVTFPRVGLPERGQSLTSNRL